jgi:AcrR family transcriptional regulator
MASTKTDISAQREDSSTRERLVRAAVTAFAASRYDRVSVRDIERQAKVNRGLAAYHFRTKEALWQEAALSLMARFHDEMQPYRAVLRAVSPHERARVMIRIYVSFSAKCPEFFRMLVMEGEQPSERTRWLAREQLTAVMNFFHQLTDTVDELQPAEEAGFTFMVVGAAGMIFAAPAICKALYGVDPGEHDFAETFADAVASVDFYEPTRTTRRAIQNAVSSAK